MNAYKGLRKAIRKSLRTEIEKAAKMAQSEAQLVGTLPCRKDQEIRIRWTRFRGERRLDLRLFVLDKAGNMIPTKKGITLKQDLVQEFLGVLDRARVDLMEQSRGE